MFFKIESWNFFSICLKKNFMKPHEISTHSAYSDNCYFHFFYGLSDWVETLLGFTKLFFEPILKVSAFYLEKKSFIPRINIFQGVANIKTKKLCLLTQFSVKVLPKIRVVKTGQFSEQYFCGFSVLPLCFWFEQINNFGQKNFTVWMNRHWELLLI